MACTLVPINLDDPSEYEELRQQRQVCGWNHTPEALALWHEKQRAGLKSFFWITTSKPAPSSASESKPGSDAESPSSEPTPIRAGHISLDAYTEPPDSSVANADKTRLAIRTFFILPDHRSSGLGRASMSLIESLAGHEPYGSPNCEFTTLDCMSKEHYYDPVLGPAVKKVQPICNQEWYERLGYVVWKVEPRYEDTVVLESGEIREVVYKAAFMRKAVVR
jgi:GNAT superfamily N-acetyltransferase